MTAVLWTPRGYVRLGAIAPAKPIGFGARTQIAKPASVKARFGFDPARVEKGRAA